MNKSFAMLWVFCFTSNLLAGSAQGIICRDDRRLSNGPLREVILSSGDEGYFLRWQYAPSLESSEVINESWAKGLECRIDEASPLAFCKTSDGQTTVQVMNRKEVYYDSLEEDAKKNIRKYIDISIFEGPENKKGISFAASHCQNLGGQA